MANPATVHVSDVGTQFRFVFVDQDDHPINLSSAVSIEIIFRSPRSSTLITRAMDVEDAVNGVAAYTTTTALFNAIGEWRTQVKLTFASIILRTEVQRFSVEQDI